MLVLASLHVQLFDQIEVSVWEGLLSIDNTEKIIVRLLFEISVLTLEAIFSGSSSATVKVVVLKAAECLPLHQTYLPLGSREATMVV